MYPIYIDITNAHCQDHCLFVCYPIETVFQLYDGGDMMCEMRRRKPEPTLLLSRGTDMRGTGLPENVEFHLGISVGLDTL